MKKIHNHRAICIGLLLLALAPALRAQSTLVVFDEDDAAGSDYRDASFGFAQGSDVLELAGPGHDKMPVETGHAFSGQTSGRLTAQHSTGTWELFVAAEGFATFDLSPYDSLVFYLNGPEAIDGIELPQIGLEDITNTKSILQNLSTFLPALDGDPATWQRVSIALGRFSGLGSFDLTRFKTVRFVAGGTNPAPRTLWLDFITVQGGSGGPVTPPTGLETLVGDRSIILRWQDDPAGGQLSYRVYRATSDAGPFSLVGAGTRTKPFFVDFTVENGTTYYYAVRSVRQNGTETENSLILAVQPHVLTDEEFLDLVQHTAFDYFWYEANPINGLIRDRSTDGSPASIAAVGFGLSAITVGIDRGWITREQGRERVHTTLKFFWNSAHSTDPTATGYRGFYYHFLDMNTGARAWSSELSTIDTALLLGGVLHARQYFDGTDETEEAIRVLADSIWHRVEWPFMRVRPPLISHGWKPESGFITFDWGGYNEAMILYLLALGSPTHPISADAWSRWTSSYSWQTHYGFSFVVFPPLFGHQYSHVWFDFRNRRDTYMQIHGIDYFENSRRATLAQRAYAMANSGRWTGYGPDAWGLTASDVPTGYNARGAPPAQNDDGTITPTAPGGSFAFTPTESLAALRHLYDTYRTSLWGIYGFKDAINPTVGWTATDYLGIDQGPILLMIENHRTGTVWQQFMAHPDVAAGLNQAGFVTVLAAEEPPVPPRLQGVYPNPAQDQATLIYTLPGPTSVRLLVYDVLGRTIAVLFDGMQPGGLHRHTFSTEMLAAGHYAVRLETENIPQLYHFTVLP